MLVKVFRVKNKSYGNSIQNNFGTISANVWALEQASKPGHYCPDIGCQYTARNFPKKYLLAKRGDSSYRQNGLLKISIPPGTKTLELQAPIGYEISSPPGPILPVPADEEVIVKFWIKTAILENMQRQIDQLLMDKQSLQRTVGDLELELEKYKELNQELEKSSQGNRDSVGQVKSLIAQRDGVIDSLKQLVAEVDGQIDDYKFAMYSKITQNYQKFLNAILNTEHALKHIKGAFVNAGELKNLNATIETLNSARDDMHENHLAYIEAGRKYWDGSIATQLTSLYDQAIKQTYGDLIIPLNENLISHLNNAWNGKQSRLVAQKKARKNIKKMLPKLRQEIEDMERIAKEVFGQSRSD